MQISDLNTNYNETKIELEKYKEESHLKNDKIENLLKVSEYKERESKKTDYNYRLKIQELENLLVTRPTIDINSMMQKIRNSIDIGIIDICIYKLIYVI